MKRKLCPNNHVIEGTTRSCTLWEHHLGPHYCFLDDLETEVYW